MAEEVRFVEVPGARLWSVRTGEGAPMVMLHGGPGMWDYLGPVAATVDDVASVVRYDQRGGGRSDGGPPYDLATAVADLEAVRMAWGVERWVVFGFDWGATLALAYAVAHPARTRGLVYVAGTGVDRSWRVEYQACRDSRLARRGSGSVLDADVADPARLPALRAWLFVDGFRVNDEAATALEADQAEVVETPAFAERLRGLGVPTLVIHGEEDPRPILYARQVAGLIPGAEMLAMPNVGHFPRFEAPELFTEALRVFLGGLPT
jgi:proline iminopeptidase